MQRQVPIFMLFLDRMQSSLWAQSGVVNQQTSPASMGMTRQSVISSYDAEGYLRRISTLEDTVRNLYQKLEVKVVIFHI